MKFIRLMIMKILGRVRSIVNYDKTYGIFLRGFANICAVSNVAYFTIKRYYGEVRGLWSSRSTPAWPTSTETATD